MIECYTFFCMYLFFGNAIGSALEQNAGRDWWPGKMRGDAINEQTLLKEKDVQRSWNFVNLCEQRCGDSIFSAATCCFSRHFQCAWQPTCLILIEGTATWHTVTIGGAPHISAVTRQCHGGAGGQMVQTQRCFIGRRGLLSGAPRREAPCFFHTHAHWNFPADFFPPGNNFFHFRTRVWLSQSAGKLSICWLSLGRNSLHAPWDDNETLPPQQARWQPPVVWSDSF